MEPNLHEYSQEECKRYNGQTVMSILTSLGDAATANQICNVIAHKVNLSKEDIETEVKRVLRRGISHGFLVKFGKNYLVSGKDNSFEIENKRKTGRSNVGQNDCISHRNVELKLEQTDNVDNNQFIVLNPNEAVKANFQAQFWRTISFSGFGTYYYEKFTWFIGVILHEDEMNKFDCENWI